LASTIKHDQPFALILTWVSSLMTPIVVANTADYRARTLKSRRSVAPKNAAKKMFQPGVFCDPDDRHRLFGLVACGRRLLQF